MEAAGFSTACCLEIDSHSCKTLKANGRSGRFLKRATILNEDIHKISAEQILKASNLSAGSVSLVYGGPPCQAFSVFGRRRGLSDPRGTLLWEFVRIVNELLPEAFVLENVSGLKTFEGKSVLSLLEDRLRLDGHYTVSTHEYELADFGVPQFRRRIFVVGSRNGIHVPKMIGTHGESSSGNLFAAAPYRTAGEALRGLSEPGDNGHIPNHKGREHSRRIVDRYRSLEFGERDPVTRINKLNPERPSFTIIVGSDAGGGKGHVHPYVPREVTPRESARMQTFPDSWAFSGIGRHVIRQVGNAVPPLFGALFGSHLRYHLFGGVPPLSYERAIKVLGLDYLRQS
jgi:DNA (cytosine-5)-methyltransferase 1